MSCAANKKFISTSPNYCTKRGLTYQQFECISGSFGAAVLVPASSEFEFCNRIWLRTHARSNYLGSYHKSAKYAGRMKIKFIEVRSLGY